MPRPHLQFRLRTLLIVVIVVGTGLGRLAYQRHSIALRRTVLAKYGTFKDHDAQPDWRRALFGDDSPAYAHRYEVQYGTRFADDPGFLHSLGTLQRIESLEMPGTDLSDDGMIHIGKLHTLMSLVIPETRVTDAGLAPLAELTNLELLDVRGTPIDGSGCVHLEQLPNLASFRAGYTRADGRAGTHLRKCPALRHVDLSYTNFDNAGLAQLAAHEKLTEIRISFTSYRRGSEVALSLPEPAKDLPERNRCDTRRNGSAFRAVAARTRLPDRPFRLLVRGGEGTSVRCQDPGAWRDPPNLALECRMSP